MINRAIMEKCKREAIAEFKNSNPGYGAIADEAVERFWANIRDYMAENQIVFYQP